MICKRLKKAILQNCGEMEVAMYGYGRACARKKTLDFSAVTSTFEQLKFDAAEKEAHLKMIIKGFCRGLASGPAL